MIENFAILSLSPTATALIAAFLSSALFSLLIKYFSNLYRVKRMFHGWQALFLSNGQVYFGKIETLTDHDIILTNIYYLTENETSNNDLTPEKINTKDYTVKKLGNEIHEPEDRMIVNRSQILFAENIKNTAPVVQAILDFESESK